MSLKWLKYSFKRQVLGTAPSLYWGARRLVRGFVEPEIGLLRHVCHPDQLTLDIGANWGAYAYVASKFSGKVHCFEPQPGLARVLQRGVGRSANVVVHNVAVSNASGWAEMRIPRNDIGYSTIEPENRLEEKADLSKGIAVVRVMTQRLDELALSRVGFVKIDVEGHEIEVLQGGLELLARDKPSLIVEVEERHRRGSVGVVKGLLGELGYGSFVLELGKLVPTSGLAAGGREHGSRNLVFLHPQAQRGLPAALF